MNLTPLVSELFSSQAFSYNLHMQCFK